MTTGFSSLSALLNSSDFMILPAYVRNSFAERDTHMKNAISQAESALNGLEAELAHGADSSAMRPTVLSIGANLRRACPGPFDDIRAMLDKLEGMQARDLSNDERALVNQIHNTLEEHQDRRDDEVDKRYEAEKSHEETAPAPRHETLAEALLRGAAGFAAAPAEGVGGPEGAETGEGTGT